VSAGNVEIGNGELGLEVVRFIGRLGAEGFAVLGRNGCSRSISSTWASPAFASRSDGISFSAWR
jgi:hypothetical protein